MKPLFNAFATGLILLGSTTAYAASTVDLTVKGLIVPSACTPVLSSGGVIDHGKISAKDLNTNSNTVIGNHTLTMVVSCDSAITFALHSVDNRAGSSIAYYGLGLINGNQKLGSFDLMLTNPIADGVAVQPIASLNGQDNWYSEKFWDPGLYMSVASMADDSQPVPVKDLSLELVVETSIARTDSLDLSNEVTLDGSATLEVKYL